MRKRLLLLILIVLPLISNAQTERFTLAKPIVPAKSGSIGRKHASHDNSITSDTGNNNLTRSASGDEAYAVFTDDGVLTFYYDDQRDSRDGIVYDIDNRRWRLECEEITKVIFHSSFSKARPTSTFAWFDGMVNLTSIEGIQYLNTSQVTDMAAMFYDCISLTSIDVSGFDTSNVTDMQNMFGCEDEHESGLAYLDVSVFNTSKVTDMSFMFWNCVNLTNLDVSGFDTRNVKDMRGMFGCWLKASNLTRLDVSGFDTRKVKDMAIMFQYLANVTALDVSSFDTSNVTDMNYMFWGCSGLTSLDVSNFNTSKVTGMKEMFMDCINLTSLDVRHFDTSNVTSMESMFYNCSGLTTLDVSSFDTSNVRDMAWMFWNCSGLTSLDVRGFNTSKVTDMSGMFGGCMNDGKLSCLDLSGFDTKEVTNMEAMFQCQENLTVLDLTSFDTSKVKDMSFMFCFCKKLKQLNVSNFNTFKVTNMTGMFQCCSELNIIDVSSFNTSIVRNMTSMFDGCNQLETIFCGDNWTTEQVVASSAMFYECSKLVGGMGTIFNSDHIDAEYARIDGGPDSPGYFTYKESLQNTCDLSDLPTSNAYYAATSFLCERAVLSGSKPDGKTNVNGKLLRSHLAKIAFRGVYLLNGRQLPNKVVSDDFPTVYEDIAVKTPNNDYYYQAARALLYLEYGDGVTPFDRNRLNFEPEATISRVNALKVLMETFNIKPDLSGTNNPFPNDADVVKMASSNPLRMGYIRKAAALGIITTDNPKFRPYDDCLRGEAFVMLSRIMWKIEAGIIPDPNPQEDSYFQPLNTTLATVGLGVGLQMGNFQHYTKTSFTLKGVVPLVFSHAYNSYNTTLPSVFFGAKTVNNIEETYQPLGDGWSHNYHSFITVVSEPVDGGAEKVMKLIVHWGGGTINVYKSENGKLVPESMGVYDEVSLNNNEVLVTSKSQMEYRFSKQGATGAAVLYLYSIKDRNGNELKINYQDGHNGNKYISSVSDGQRSLTFFYEKDTDLLKEVKDPLGRSIKFAYFDNKQTGKKQLKSFTDAEGNTTTYDYADLTKASTSKLLSRIQLPKGNYIENEYDANRRLSQTVSGVNGVPTTKTSVSVTANYGGNAVNTQSQIDIERGSQTTSYHYTYNENNVVTRMTGDKGLYMDGTYGDEMHPELPTAMHNNKTDVNSITYDKKGNLTSITVTGDGELTTSMTYDEMNNLTSVTDPMGNTTTYNYDSNGNLIEILSPIEDIKTGITIGDKGLPIEIKNAMGVITKYGYNKYGNVETVSLPTLNLSSKAQYDAASRLVSATDALNRTTSFTYNKNDYLTSETDAMNHKTIYEYDANSNLTTITNAKNGVTTMVYDNATDWLKSVEFAGAKKQYDYNKDGTLNRFTKPDGTALNYSYDELGRVTYDGVNEYTYDDKLRLQSISGGGKTLTLTYDGFNRVTETNCGGTSNSYTYDKNGNCTSVNNTTYGYDELNRLTSVTFRGNTINYTYPKDSRLEKVEYPNGMITTYGYDKVGRLTSKETVLRNGTVIASYSYKLDNVGNITEQTAQEPYGDFVMANENVSYTYNEGNRITKAGDIEFEFDKNGNTKKRGSESYSWDVRDRMTQAGNTAITYDPLGLIASYGDITFTTSPLGMGNVLSDSKSGAEYIYGNGLEARVKNGSVSYYVTDFRGSVVAIVDQNGNITHKYQYDEFGKVTQKQESDYNPFQYVGKYGVMYLNDHQYYMRARHYDPTIGRFLSEDPIWSTNLYPYAENNPIAMTDTSGNSSESIQMNNSMKELDDFMETLSFVGDNVELLNQLDLIKESGLTRGLSRVTLAYDIAKGIVYVYNRDGIGVFVTIFNQIPGVSVDRDITEFLIESGEKGVNALTSDPNWIRKYYPRKYYENN